MDLKELEALARDYSDRQGVLERRVRDAEAAVAAVKREHVPGIRRAAQAAAERKDRLVEFVRGHGDLFRKPRTRTFFGIRVGLRKQPGKVTTSPQTIGLIERLLPDRRESLISVTKRVKAAALRDLGSRELLSIGATAGEAADKVVVEQPDGEFDKLVDAYLDGDPDAEAAA